MLLEKRPSDPAWLTYWCPLSRLEFRGSGDLESRGKKEEGGKSGWFHPSHCWSLPY